MLIDSCASGGRRNDLETMRRAVPLWRSDYAYEPIGHQCMTYGISFWLPYHGTGTVASTAAPYYGGGIDAGRALRLLEQRRAEPRLRHRHAREGDRLRNAPPALRPVARDRARTTTATSIRSPPGLADEDAWIAWQFDRPEAGEGMVQAFRREESIFLAARVPLRGLDPAAHYEVTRLDATEETSRASGRKLIDEGLPITIPERSGAAVFSYRRLPRS